MMLRHKIIPILYFLILTLCLQACDKVNGLEPDENAVPESTAKLVIESFPNAKDVILKVIKKDELWEAQFVSDHINYFIGLNTTQIVATHKIVGTSIPDSISSLLMDYIPIAKNGVFSEYKEDVTNKFYRAKLTVDQTDYLVKWFWTSTSLQIKMEIYSVFEFDTDVRYDLLPAVLTEFSKRTGYFIVKLKTQVLSDNHLVYLIMPENRSSFMVLNDKGVLVGSYNSVLNYRSFDELPKFLQDKLIYYGVERYELSVSTFKFSEDNTVGYYVSTFAGRGGGYKFFFDENGNLTSLNNDLNLAIR